MFEELEKINSRPRPYEFYTAKELWTGEHTSKQMLAYHLNEDIDVSSRNGAFIDRSVQWIAGKFQIGRGLKIADFGCGPGLYATRLAKKGARVTGIDFSARSLQYARKTAADQGLSIQYVHGDYLEFETGDRYGLILMIMCDFCALSPDQRKILLKKFHELLEKGGRVLLDVYSLPAFENRKETALYEEGLLDGFWSPEKYYGFLNTFLYQKEKVALDKYTLVDEKGMRIVYNWLQYFSPDGLKKEFEKNGFFVEKFYSDVAGRAFDPTSTEFAVLAGKSGE